MLPHYLSYEERLAEQRKSLPVHAFFSVGSLETDQVPYFHQFIEVLKRRNYEGLRLDTLVVEGEKHATAEQSLIVKGYELCMNGKWIMFSSCAERCD